MTTRRTAASKPVHSQRLDDQLCFALYSTMLGVNKVYRQLLRALGLTYPQYLVMLVLWERDELTVSGICERLFLDSPTVTPLLKRLEAQGLLARRRSAADEREVRVTLTAKGRALKERAGGVPSCMAAATRHPVARIAELRESLKGLRSQLADWPGMGAAADP